MFPLELLAALLDGVTLLLDGVKLLLDALLDEEGTTELDKALLEDDATTELDEEATTELVDMMELAAISELMASSDEEEEIMESLEDDSPGISAEILYLAAQVCILSFCFELMS